MYKHTTCNFSYIQKCVWFSTHLHTHSVMYTFLIQAHTKLLIFMQSLFNEKFHANNPICTHNPVMKCNYSLLHTNFHLNIYTNIYQNLFPALIDNLLSDDRNKTIPIIQTCLHILLVIAFQSLHLVIFLVILNQIPLFNPLGQSVLILFSLFREYLL